MGMETSRLRSGLVKRTTFVRMGDPAGRPDLLASHWGWSIRRAAPCWNALACSRRPPRSEVERTAHQGWVTKRRAARVEPPSHELGDLSCT